MMDHLTTLFLLDVNLLAGREVIQFSSDAEENRGQLHSRLPCSRSKSNQLPPQCNCRRCRFTICILTSVRFLDDLENACNIMKTWTSPVAMVRTHVMNMLQAVSAYTLCSTKHDTTGRLWIPVGNEWEIEWNRGERTTCLQVDQSRPFNNWVPP
jgi:hypothetical protein